MNLSRMRHEEPHTRNQIERKWVAVQTAPRATEKQASHESLSLQFSLLWKQYSRVHLNEILNAQASL